VTKKNNAVNNFTPRTDIAQTTALKFNIILMELNFIRSTNL